jgi:site-specific recombinase XerD
MKTTKNFSFYVENFFLKYLTCEIGASMHTIRSYRDTFTLFLEFMKKAKGVDASRLELSHLKRPCILDFLEWLQEEKGCMASSRNTRLSALRSFFRYLTYEDPIHLNQWEMNLGIRFKKEHKETVKHMVKDGIKYILEQIPSDTRQGRKHLTLISLMYETGARVQEIINLTPASLRLVKPCIITLKGKGNKSRLVPLDDNMVTLLSRYMKENSLDMQQYRDRPLFPNHHGTRLTSQGVTFILQSYADQARKLHPDAIPNSVSPHMLRHSRAMHLLQSGVNLIYIRDILGHVSVQSTEVYARADTRAKREALEKVELSLGRMIDERPSWEQDPKLKAFLKGLV